MIAFRPSFEILILPQTFNRIGLKIQGEFGLMQTSTAVRDHGCRQFLMAKASLTDLMNKSFSNKLVMSLKQKQVNLFFILKA